MLSGGAPSPSTSVKILITGSTGLLGQALSARLAPSCNLTTLSRHAATPMPGVRHLVADLADPEQAVRAIRDAQPDLILHAQALSDVDRCEREPASAQAQNVLPVIHLRQALASDQRALLVSISTDYVFDGTKGEAYDERDMPRPLSVYGASKRSGEEEALRRARAMVVRTGTLFGLGRPTFCEYVAAQVRVGQPVEAFVDQWTSPTFTKDVADAVAELSFRRWQSADGQWPRVVHVTNAGGCSRVEFARRIATLTGGDPELVRAVPMASQRRPAARPANSMLSSIHVPTLLGRSLRTWDDALCAHLR